MVRLGDSVCPLFGRARESPLRKILVVCGELAGFLTAVSYVTRRMQSGPMRALFRACWRGPISYIAPPAGPDGVDTHFQSWL